MTQLLDRRAHHSLPASSPAHLSAIRGRGKRGDKIVQPPAFLLFVLVQDSSCEERNEIMWVMLFMEERIYFHQVYEYLAS